MSEANALLFIQQIETLGGQVIFYRNYSSTLGSSGTNPELEQIVAENKILDPDVFVVGALPEDWTTVTGTVARAKFSPKAAVFLGKHIQHASTYIAKGC